MATRYDSASTRLQTLLGAARLPGTTSPWGSRNGGVLHACFTSFAPQMRSPQPPSVHLQCQQSGSPAASVGAESTRHCAYIARRRGLDARSGPRCGLDCRLTGSHPAAGALSARIRPPPHLQRAGMTRDTGQVGQLSAALRMPRASRISSRLTVVRRARART